MVNNRIESPCVRNCCLDENDICLGCFRSLNEVTQWGIVDEKTQREFLANAAERKSQRELDRKVAQSNSGYNREYSDPNIR